ncbi:hypothetical protein [Lysobacter olei]
MAETARSWAVLQALQARLQGITVDAGYRTDAGADVRLEPSQLDAGAPRITLYSGGTVRGEQASEREFTLVAEAMVPTDLDDAHALVVAIAEDIEQALDAYTPMPQALPLRFQESLFLDRPEGIPAMVAQLMFITRYRR